MSLADDIGIFVSGDLAKAAYANSAKAIVNMMTMDMVSNFLTTLHITSLLPEPQLMEKALVHVLCISLKNYGCWLRKSEKKNHCDCNRSNVEF